MPWENARQPNTCPPALRNPKLKSCEKACKREKENILKTSVVWPAVESSKCSSQFEKQSSVASAASATKILTLDRKTEEKKDPLTWHARN